jgi:hypothetical protein
LATAAAAAQQDAVTTKLEEIVKWKFCSCRENCGKYKIVGASIGWGGTNCERDTAREREIESNKYCRSICKSGEVWRVVRCGGRTEAVYKSMLREASGVVQKQSFRQRRG